MEFKGLDLGESALELWYGSANLSKRKLGWPGIWWHRPFHHGIPSRPIDFSQADPKRVSSLGDITSISFFQ